MTSKKKSITLTMEERLNVLEDLKISTIPLVAEKYNVTDCTVRRIRKNAEKIMEFANKNTVHKNRRRLKISANQDLERPLVEWVREREARGDPVSNALLLQKAAELRNTMGCSNFTRTQAWLRLLKVRNGIRLLRHPRDREIANADEDGAKRFVDDFQKLIEEEGITLDNIYNIDETTLPWKTIIFKTEGNEKSVNRRMVHNRIIVALCTNASGTHKLMPIVVYKYKNPRALKNYEDRLPVILRAQSNTRMTESLFVDWYQNNFKPSVRARQVANSRLAKVILLLNNTSGHTVPTEMLETRDFKIMYLPPNTANLIQPMSKANGIIAKLKLLYRRKTLRRAASYTCELNEFYKHFTIKDCIHLLDRSWTEITTDHIRNAWKKIIPEHSDTTIPVQHVSFEIEESVSKEGVIPTMRNCEEVENRIYTKEANVHQRVEANENTREEPEDEGEKLIVVATETYSRDELKYIFERLGEYASRRTSIIQHMFQVFKNHFLGPNDGTDSVDKWKNV